MKTMLCFLLVLFSCHSVAAKKIEMTLKEAKNWHNSQLLDSVTVTFSAKGHHLEFRQAFQEIRGAQRSKAIILSQKDQDLEHFKSALLIVTTASGRALPDDQVHLDKILRGPQGLSGRIIFDQYLNSTDSWHSMCSIFSWAKLLGKAHEIKIIAYTHQRR